MAKKRENNFRFYLPRGAAETIWDYCQDNSLFKKPEVDCFKYLFIVHTITTHFNTHHLSHIATRGRDNENYAGCPLNVKTLAPILGVNNGKACSLLKTLMDIGIIQRKKGYVVGQRSYCYVLASNPDEFTTITALPAYSANAVKIFKKRNSGNNDSSAIKLYRKELQNISISIPPGHEYYQYVEASKGEMKHLYHTSVSSAYPISSYSSSSLSSLPPVYFTPMVGKNEHKALKLATSNTSVILEKNKYESSILDYVSIQKTTLNIIALQAILDKDWFVHRPVKKSRVYTNLTNLKREFRELLRYDGKPLMEFDIRNSQPLIASTIIRDYWIRKSKTIPADVIHYQHDCEAGTFYDYFMDINNEAEENRRKFKVDMFGQVFFSKVTKRNTKLKKQFIFKYPNVYTAICDIKGGIGSETYNRFAILLQQREASIIFDRVNIGLLKDDIPAFNIFDSILCLPNHKEIVRERILDAFSVLNITPTINYKEYTQNN